MKSKQNFLTEVFLFHSSVTLKVFTSESVYLSAIFARFRIPIYTFRILVNTKL